MMSFTFHNSSYKEVGDEADDAKDGDNDSTINDEDKAEIHSAIQQYGTVGKDGDKPDKDCYIWLFHQIRKNIYLYKCARIGHLPN
jgi:hypothetical protein